MSPDSYSDTLPGKNDCFLAASDSSRIFCYAHCALLSAVCMLRGTQSRVQGSFYVFFPRSEAFDGDEGRRLPVRHVSGAAFIVHYPHYSPQHVLVCADRDTNHRHPFFAGNADVKNAFQEIHLLRHWGVPFRWYGLGGDGHDADAV